MYAFVIGNPWNEKNVNVFKVKDLEIYEHDFQTQREELKLSHTLHLIIIKYQQEIFYYDWRVK